MPSFLTVSNTPVTSSGTIDISATSTGTGSVVLQTSPSLTTPNIGVASGTSLSLSGNLTSNGAIEVVNASPTVTIRTAANDGGFVYFGNSAHGIGRISNDVVLYTTTGSLQFRTAGSGGSNILTAASTGITVPVGGVSIATFGPASASTTSTSVMVRNSGTANLEFCIAGAVGNFSTQSLVGDGIIRAGTGNLILQSAGANMGMRITTSNNVEVRNALSVGNVSNLGVQLQCANTVANKKISLFDTNLNDNQFYGLGINSSTFRYQVPSTIDSHVFFAGTASMTSNELFRITGTGNIGIGNATPNAPLQLATTLVNRKVVLYDTENTNNQFYGFGVNSNTLRYQVPTTSDSHIFYAGTAPTTSNQVFKIQGDGKIFSNDVHTSRGDTTGAYFFGSGNEFLFYNGTNFEFSKPLVSATVVSWGLYEMTGIVGVPDATEVVCGNWGVISTVGSALTYNAGTGNYENNLGRDVYVTVTVHLNMDAAPGAGAARYKLQDNTGRNWARSDVTANDYTCLSATIGLNNGGWFRLLGFQQTGSGKNMQNGSLKYIFN